ncbi:MAG: histidine kinase [Bacteroidales bacterium]|nr:histidine kinase [Bacteroidales bacterium]
MIFSSIISLMMAIVLVYPDLYIIAFLNRKFPWQHNIIARILLQIVLSSFFAIIISSIFTTFVYSLGGMNDDYSSVMLNNALIVSVINLMAVISLEAWLFFNIGKMSFEKAEILERELEGIRYETLKSQMSPHFLFNSLNVLSGLIPSQAKDAREFVDVFAGVYRYVLENIDHNLVQLEDEINFSKKYIYLQQKRYGEHLNYSIHIEAEALRLYLPPLSLQVLLENAIKHNALDRKRPLFIELRIESNQLSVKNNLIPRVSKPFSSGLGIKHLKTRYGVFGLSPIFETDQHHYTAILPLIPVDES